MALALPVLLITIDFDEVLPTTTFPKFQDVGFKTIEAAGAATPVPVKVRFAGEFGASLSTDTLPLPVPVAAGAKFTVNEVEAPAANVSGRANPVTL